MLNFRWVPKMVIIKAGDTFSKAHHFGALQPLVFFSGCREWQVLKVFSWNLGKKSVKQVQKVANGRNPAPVGRNNLIFFVWFPLMEKNPAPLDMVNFPLFTSFHTHVRWLFGISEPSTVCDLHFCGSNFGSNPTFVEESLRPGWVRVGGTGKLPSTWKDMKSN